MSNSTSYIFSDSFEASDYYRAQRAFSAWQSRQYTELDDYLLRQRKSELYALVNKVVENELDKTERLIVKLRFSENRTLKEIADVLDVDTSTVSRRLDKIDDTLYEKLKYAIEYRFGKNAKDSMVLVKRSVSDSCKTEAKNTIASRLRDLRGKSFLQISDVAKCTAISASVLEKAEKGDINLNAIDLMALSEFYAVTSDYILFGKKRVIRDKTTGKPVCYCC